MENKKTKKIIISIIIIIIFLVFMLVINFITMPSFNKGIKNLQTSENYMYKFSLNGTLGYDEEALPISAYIVGKVDTKEKFTEGSFFSSIDEVNIQRNFLISNSKNGYELFEENLGEYQKKGIINDAYSNVMIDFLTKLDSLKKDIIKSNLLKVTYKTQVNRDKLFELFSIYNEYLGINKNNLNDKDYDLYVTVNRKGYIEKVEIHIGDNLSLSGKKNYRGFVLRINFDDYNKVTSDKVLLELTRHYGVEQIGFFNNNIEKTSPKLEKIEIVEPNNGNYLTGEKIKFKVLWSMDIFNKKGKNISLFTSPVLKIKFGDGKVRKAKFISSKDNEILYEYKVTNNDHGKIELNDYYGLVYSKEKKLGIIIKEDLKLSGNTNIIVNSNKPIEPEIPEIPIKPDIPNNKFNSNQLRELARNIENLNTGIDRTQAEILDELRNLLGDKEFDDLTLVKLDDYIIKIRNMYTSNKPLSGKVKYTKSNEFARLPIYANAHDDTYIYSIIEPAVIHADNVDTNVNILSISGSETTGMYSGELTENFIRGLENNKNILQSVIFHLADKVKPENYKDKPKLIITGISMGGMIAQQIAAIPEIQASYDIINVITYGSPVVLPTMRTNVNRLKDAKDVISDLKVSNKEENNKINNNEEKISNGNYDSFISSHMLGYIEDNTWSEYDILGNKNGNATIEVDFQNYSDEIISEDNLPTPILKTPQGGIHPFEYTMGFSLSISTEGPYSSNNIKVAGMEIYEKENNEYKLLKDIANETNVHFEVDVGEKVVLVARAYIYDKQHNKVYSDYSNELTMDNTKVLAPTLTTPEGGKPNGILWMNMSITQEGFYSDGFVPKGIQLFEKIGNEYKLYREIKNEKDYNIYVNPGDKKVFVARVYYTNKIGEKIYSDYSNEIVADNSGILKPILTAPQGGNNPHDFTLGFSLLVSLEGIQLDSNGKNFGIEIYEKLNGNYKLVKEAFNTTTVQYEIDVGKKETLVARIYILNEKKEKNYSDYSNELTMDNTKVLAPTLTTPEGGKPNGILWMNISITQEGFYSDGFVPKGIQLFEKIGNEYKLYREIKNEKDYNIYVNPGDKKVFVARVYYTNKIGEKIYSDYSNEIVADNSEIPTPTLRIANSKINNNTSKWVILDILGEIPYKDNDYKVDGIEYYVKNGSRYQLVKSLTGTQPYEFTLYRTKKVYVARVYVFDKNHKKIYSNYSNEITVDTFSNPISGPNPINPEIQ